jgi:hypothetical protein
MATVLYMAVSIVLLGLLFVIYAVDERARRRGMPIRMVRRYLRSGRHWSFDPPDQEDGSPGAVVRTASNSRGWR